MASLICIIMASSILKSGCYDSSIRVNFWLLFNLVLCEIDILPLVCYSQTDQVRGINRCQKLRKTSGYHFLDNTCKEGHLNRNAENKGKKKWKKTKFLATSPKKVLLFWSFYYYGFLLNKNPWLPPNRLLCWSFLLYWS